MDNTRMSRINRLIQKEVSDLFRIQTQRLPGTLISVTSVTVSPDLSIARVRLSIFPSERSEELLESIRANAKAIRYDLGLRVGKQLRKLPELTFFIDDSLDYLERIDTLLGLHDK
ncbi:30S ribosome-binding factor RbfA [uncultured Porphyromonas sp.]|uniref:30S ribosome-binding factor RbfA n=1 Tax=uncultured Porphyromonas sp. TaxID=159274 RepID=UPI0026098622|nr:30S ribosome-binding factor RbfA [uncultured Porphyromonas sp.]